MTPRISGGTSAPSRRSGLLFPGGPTRRDRRPLMLGFLVLAGAGLWFVNSRSEDVPPPVAIIASRPAAGTGVPVTRRAEGGTVPTTWEELTAARAAALRNRAPEPAPVALAEPDEEVEEREPPRRVRREPQRRRTEEREEQPPPPAVEPAPPSGEPGRLSVNAIPWGQLIVDGRIYGNTPRLNMPIAIGTRRIRIAREGFEPFDTTITVEPGESIRLTGITLRAQP